MSTEAKSHLKSLADLAIRSGATRTAVLPTDRISVEDKLARLCREPQCKNFGRSRSCPPYVKGPAEFRSLLKKMPDAIFVRIDLPKEVLFSAQRQEAMMLLHAIVAEVEQAAVDSGFSNSKAFAGGSCKEIFCQDYPDCPVVAESGNCRNPNSARPSMSGYGVNVSKLMAQAGWSDEINVAPPEQDTDAMSWVAGLILVG